MIFRMRQRCENGSKRSAKKCYPLINKHFTICSLYDDYMLSYPCVGSLPGIFGHFIRSIDWRNKIQNEYEAEMSSSIEKYCGNYLFKLWVRECKLDFNIEPHFSALQDLCTAFGSLYNSKAPPKLKELRIASVLTKLTFQAGYRKKSQNLLKLIFKVLDKSTMKYSLIFKHQIYSWKHWPFLGVRI